MLFITVAGVAGASFGTRARVVRPGRYIFCARAANRKTITWSHRYSTILFMFLSNNRYRYGYLLIFYVEKDER